MKFTQVHMYIFHEHILHKEHTDVKRMILERCVKLCWRKC